MWNLCVVQHDSRFTMEDVSPRKDHVNMPYDSKVWKRNSLHLRLRVFFLNIYFIIPNKFIYYYTCVKLVKRICILKVHTNVKCDWGRYVLIASLIRIEYYHFSNYACIAEPAILLKLISSLTGPSFLLPWNPKFAICTYV